MAIIVFLNRTKVKTHLVKFESPQPHGPVNFLYLAAEADARLGQPRAIRITVEGCSPVVSFEHPEMAHGHNKEHPFHVPENQS